MRHWIAFPLIVVCLATTTGAFAQKECDGPFKGKKPTDEQLAEVLAVHKSWVKDGHPDGDERRANLCEAKLFDANLSGARLGWANLSGARLSGAVLFKANLGGADLSGAVLKGADLRKAHLGRADLREAELLRANLSEANLFGANLSGAKLTRVYLNETNLFGANLSGANLYEAVLFKADLSGANLSEAALKGADLREAILREAILREANLRGANLTKALLEKTNVKDAELTNADLTEALYHARSTPDSASVSGLEGLRTIRFERGQQDGLVLLRNVLEEAGLRELEREATFSLEHWKTTYSPQPERFLKRLFFEATSCYGLCYERPLIIIGVFIGLFALVYLIPISDLPKHASPESGIFRIWPSGRLVAGNPKPHVEVTEEADRYHATGVRVIRYALYFSLLSAFHFGWRDLNVGNWIARLQGQQYALRATGWVRTVSGAQSLISIYLVALWVLTYFGRPFQ